MPRLKGRTISIGRRRLKKKRERLKKNPAPRRKKPMPKIVGVRESHCWRPIFDTWFDEGCVIPEHFRDAAKALVAYEDNPDYDCTSRDWFKYLRFYIDGPNDNMAKDTEEFIVWCQHVGIFIVKPESMKPAVLELNRKQLDAMIYDQNVLVVLNHFKDREEAKYCGMGFPTARDIARDYDFDPDFVYSVIVWMKCESAFKLTGHAIRPAVVDKLIKKIVERNRAPKKEKDPMPQYVQEELTKLRQGQLSALWWIATETTSEAEETPTYGKRMTLRQLHKRLLLTRAFKGSSGRKLNSFINWASECNHFILKTDDERYQISLPHIAHHFRDKARWLVQPYFPNALLGLRWIAEKNNSDEFDREIEWYHEKCGPYFSNLEQTRVFCLWCQWEGILHQKTPGVVAFVYNDEQLERALGEYMDEQKLKEATEWEPTASGERFPGEEKALQWMVDNHGGSWQYISQITQGIFEKKRVNIQNEELEWMRQFMNRRPTNHPEGMKNGVEYFGIDYQAAENRLYEIAETRKKMGHTKEAFKGEKRVLQYLLREAEYWEEANKKMVISKAIEAVSRVNRIDVDVLSRYSVDHPWIEISGETRPYKDGLGNAQRKKVSVARVDIAAVRRRIDELGVVDIDHEMDPEVQLRALMMTLKHEHQNKSWEDLINAPWDCHIQAAGGFKSMWRKIATDMKQRGIIKVVREAGKEGDRHMVDTGLLKKRMEELQRVIEMKGGRCSEVVADSPKVLVHTDKDGKDHVVGDTCPSCEETRIKEEIAAHRKQLASLFKTSMGSGPPPGEVAASIVYGHATALAGTEHVDWLQEQIRNAKNLKSEPTRYMQWMKASELLSRVDSRVSGTQPVEDGLLLSNYQRAVQRLDEMTQE